MEDGVRLQKILADAGIASRREAERMIKDGEVTVNGKVAKVGDKAVPGEDHIKVRGKLLRAAPNRVVVVIYKPRGVLTHKPTDAESHVDTVLDLMPRIKEKVRPVGRLDSDAEGVLLLTNDGELGLRLAKPSFEVEKVFSVKIDGHLDAMKIKRLTHGVKVEGVKTKPTEVEVSRGSEGKEWIRIKTTEARNRHIRKMFEAIGRPVDKVRRESFAGISLKGLVRGQYRYLTEEEVTKLRRLVGLA